MCLGWISWIKYGFEMKWVRFRKIPRLFAPFMETVCLAPVCSLSSHDYQACICRSLTLFNAIRITLQWFCSSSTLINAIIIIIIIITLKSILPWFVVSPRHEKRAIPECQLPARHLVSCGGDFDINQPFLWTIVTWYEGKAEQTSESLWDILAPKLHTKSTHKRMATDFASGWNGCIVCVYIYIYM